MGPTIVTPLKDIQSELASAEIRAALSGKKCWYAFSSFGSTVGLDLGRKVLRPRPLRNRAHKPEYRKYEGERHLILWCSWRLERSGLPIISSDGTEPQCQEHLQVLVGRMVRQVEISPSWDLRLVFSGDVALIAFPDHVGQAAGFDGNWELWTPEQAYLVGTDLECKVIDRQNRVLAPIARQDRWVVRRPRAERTSR